MSWPLPISTFPPQLLFIGGGALRGPQATGLKDDDLIACWPSTSLIDVVVVGGRTNRYDQVAKMTQPRNISIDKWM